jgi:uncharacterized protein (DUF1499 family)
MGKFLLILTFVMFSIIDIPPSSIEKNIEDNIKPTSVINIDKDLFKNELRSAVMDFVNDTTLNINQDSVYIPFR